MKAIHSKSLLNDELKSLFGAAFVAIISTCFLILASAIFGLLIPVGEKASAIIAYLTYDLSVAGGCYYLCLKNPESIWFVPFICNVTGIISAFTEPNFWQNIMWVLILFGWMLSLVASIWGHDTGRREIERQKIQR